MSEQVLIGLFTLAGAIAGGLITGWFSLKSSKIGFEKEKMEKDIRKLANQVISYWFLEKEYITQIRALDPNNTPELTIMRNTRKVVNGKGHGKPNMTENDVNEILQKYE